MSTPDDRAAARTWVLARFDRPDADDLDDLVRESCERDPWFALLLKEKIAERVELHRACPSGSPGSYRQARGVLRPIDDATEVLIRSTPDPDSAWARQHRERCRRAEELTREILGDDD